jgi:hypothetical protein
MVMAAKATPKRKAAKRRPMGIINRG